MNGERCTSLLDDRCLHGFPTDGACVFAKAHVIRLLPFCMREDVCGRIFNFNGGKPIQPQGEQERP